MFRVETTAEFDRWLDGLRDRQTKAKVATRIVRIEAALLGDWKPVGGGVSELRIDHGPGYRLYYTLREQVIVLLLCGSDKRDQEKAIRLAKDLARKLQ
jgi:putative addiction module killer protein